MNEQRFDPQSGATINKNSHLAMKRVADRLKKKRIAIPMYAKEAAEICGITPGHYSRIENGQVNHWTPAVIDGAAKIMDEKGFELEAELNEAPPAAWEQTYLEQVKLTRDNSNRKTEELKINLEVVLEEKMQCLSNQLNENLQKNVKELQVNLVHEMEVAMRALMAEIEKRTSQNAKSVKESFEAGRAFFLSLNEKLETLQAETDKENQESKDYWAVIRMEQAEATAKVLEQMESIIARGEALNEIVREQFS